MLFGQIPNDPICIGEKFEMHAEILNQDRVIYIRLPKDYDTSNVDYPVHFILDAEVTFHIYTGLIEILAEDEQIQDAIIIGIPNVDRNFDFDPKANGYKFLEFITEELIPYVDREYRTNGNRLLCGYSMGGTYVIFALMNATDSFNNYLSGSPYRLNIFSDSAIDDLSKKIRKTRTLYTSIGENDLEQELERFTSFCEMLDKATINDLSFKYEVIPDRDHYNSFTINWQDGLNFISNNPEP
jgi:predicted alpha/beta superfamily hydrolase